MKIEMPHSVMIEECLIGLMLSNQEDAEKAPDLSKDLFYDPKNQELFEVIASLIEKGKSISTALILEEKKRRTGKFSQGDLAYLTDLIQKTPKAIDPEEYIEELSDLSERRRAISICWDILPKLSTTSGKDTKKIDEIIDEAIQGFSGIEQTKRSMRSIGEIMKEDKTLDKIKERYEYYQRHGHKKLSEKTIATKLYGLDTFLGGLEASRLYILGARPGVGKTALSLGISISAAEEGHGTALFSLEMSERELIHRYLAWLSQRNIVDIQMGSLKKDDLASLETVSERIESLPLSIDQKSFTLTQIRSEIRRLKRSSNLELVVIDYLQLITPKKSSGDNRYFATSEISRELKLIAKEFDVAVLCLSQLSRSSEKEKRGPRLSDLRDSGSIEQDADVVMLIERYGDNTKLKIAKNRHGPVGEVKLSFHGPTGRFRE